MENDQYLKETIANHFHMGQAFVPIDKIVNRMPFSKVGIRPANLPYSFFELFYHIQFAQKDILNYCLEEGYEAPSWPDDYWPSERSPLGVGEWEALKKDYIDTRKRLHELVLSSDTSLSSFVKGQKTHCQEDVHTFFREMLLVLEHSAYHTGQMVLVTRLLDEY